MIKRLLVNRSEVASDQALSEAATRAGYRVDAKTRLADVVEVSGFGLSDADFNYARAAHLDFVITSGEDRNPEFAVEFDGPRHRTDPKVAAHDRVKDAVCRANDLTLLRIDCSFLRRWGRFTLIGWLVEVWRLYEGFRSAQDAGQIPEMEDFCWFLVFEATPDGRGLQSYDIAANARVAVAEAYERGIVAAMGMEFVSPPYCTADTDEIVGYSLIGLPGGRALIAKARCRTYRFHPVNPRELVEVMSNLEAEELLRAYEAGRHLPASAELLAKFRQEAKGWIRDGWLLEDLPYDPHAPFEG
jgi:hypothetical protein